MARKAKGQKRAEKTRKRAQRQTNQEQRLAQQVLAQLGEWDQNGLELLPHDEDLPSPGVARRLMETMMRGLASRMGMTSSDATQERAIRLCDQAMEASPAKAAKLARQALEVWPDCAEADVILAELAGSVSEALPFYEHGVAAGRRALADEWDSLRNEEAFWGYLPTRPFMRALAGLADVLWGVGRRDEAAERYLELLTLNPNDNQGIRMVAVPRLMELGRNDDCARILKHYADGADCFTVYNLALLEFRQRGDSFKAKRLLKKAFQANEHVPAYLVGNRMLPRRRPDSYSWQSPEEAQIYVDESQRAWKTTAGAIAWMRAEWSPTDDAPEALEAGLLLQLPQRDETWLLVAAPVPSPSAEDSQPGCAMMLTDLATDAVVASEVFDEPPATDDILYSVSQSFAFPKSGTARRPRRIEFVDEELCAALQSDLDDIGIEAEVSQDDELRERFQRGIARLQERIEFTGDSSELPIADDEGWAIDCQQLDSWLRDDDGQLQRPWAMLVLGPTGILTSQITLQTPTVQDWQKTLRSAMTNPLMGDPRRPAQIWVRNADQQLLLAPLLEGIPCVVRDDLAFVDDIFNDLSQTLDGRSPLTPYVQQAGMTVERVGHFFQSAADYFRRAPWTFTPSDAVWEVQPAGCAHPWFATVIGQNGESFGLSLIEHFDDCVRMMSGALLDGGVLSISAMALNFEESHTLTGADLDAVEQFDWPIAAPEAYPLVYRTGLSDTLQTPSAEDFDLLDAAIQTLPDFIASGREFGTQTANVQGSTIDVRIARVPTKRLKPKSRR